MSTISKTIRVGRSLEDLADLLGARPPEWLLPFASIAVHTAESSAARRGGSAATSARARRISIDLTDVPQDDDAARVDVGVQWETRGFSHVFSRFEGRLVATRNHDESCSVTITGQYASPKGRIGRRDHDAAENAVDMLLSTLRTAVEEQARATV